MSYIRYKTICESSPNILSLLEISAWPQACYLSQNIKLSCTSCRAKWSRSLEEHGHRSMKLYRDTMSCRELSNAAPSSAPESASFLLCSTYIIWQSYIMNYKLITASCFVHSTVINNYKSTLIRIFLKWHLSWTWF